MAFRGRFVGALVITTTISCANAAQAEERNLEFRVCARPSNVPAWWKMWSYMGNRPAFETTERKEFDAKTEGLAVFIFDPEAPPNSVRVLPIPYNQLTCPPPPPKPEPKKSAPPAPKPPPPPPPPPPKKAAPKEAPKPKPKPIDESSPGIKRMPVQPEPEKVAKTSPEQTESTPPPPSKPLPSSEDSLPKTNQVLPTAKEAQLGLPKSDFKALCASSRKSDGTNPRHKPGFAELKGLERIAYELAFAAAIANGQFNEDLHQPGSTPRGILGGKDPNGPDSAVVQAAVSIAQMASGAVITQASKFVKKLKQAIKAEERLVLNVDDLTEEAAELLAKKYGPDIAHALMVNGTIGRYSVMRKFTENLGAEYQAHHIFEAAKIKRLLKDADPDQFPAVILTKDQHLKITKRLAEATRDGVKDLAHLWSIYEDVYAAHPHWLDAIRPYFKK